MSHRDQYPLLSLIIEKGVPLTRENYLTLAYMGDPPERCPELEDQLPGQFHDWEGRSFGPRRDKSTPQGDLGNTLGGKAPAGRFPGLLMKGLAFDLGQSLIG